MTRPGGLTYPEVGATAGPLPTGYDHTVRSRIIGTGDRTFRRAAESIAGWQLHRRAGVAVTADSPVATRGAHVSLRLRWGPFVITAPCRVVYVVDEPRRRGFAYGTLHGHPERGEEYFGVEWCGDDTVVLTIRAFSRPATWWSRAGAPVARAVQRRITDRYLRSLDE
ncbi:DUF1990 family protein [Rhodococcus phenolicus]|uniref:DUF1990 family protein n=1 Tax=Rhodococcus phenolicus TaxID=263849 RepID=UPI0008364BD6|nr:DUF1990 domain-containing protein [Rhodococcus phenolicus]